jgi:hypothetical protein
MSDGGDNARIEQRVHDAAKSVEAAERAERVIDDFGRGLERRVEGSVGKGQRAYDRTSGKGTFGFFSDKTQRKVPQDISPLGDDLSRGSGGGGVPYGQTVKGGGDGSGGVHYGQTVGVGATAEALDRDVVSRHRGEAVAWYAAGHGATGFGSGFGSNSVEVDQRASRPPRAKALLIGVNYFDPVTPELTRLRGCLNDVASQVKVLSGTYGFKTDAEHMRVLFDEPAPHSAGAMMCGCGAGRDEKGGAAVPAALRGFTPRRAPTQAEVRLGIQWLLHDARCGDTLVFHFSGHGTQVPDENGDEEDGMDEAICTVDLDWYTNMGICDDELREKLFLACPEGVELVAFFDCCHSGTMSDMKAIRVADASQLQSRKNRYGSRGKAGANGDLGRYCPPPPRAEKRSAMIKTLHTSGALGRS